MNVYIAAPLFNEMERKRNEDIALFIEALGFTTYLPQRDGGIAYDLIEESVSLKSDIRRNLFNLDYEALKASDIILFLIDGRTPDEGACIELGMGYALGKKCMGYKTDSRAMDANGDNNIMIDGCVDWFMYDNKISLGNALKRMFK